MIQQQKESRVAPLLASKYSKPDHEAPRPLATLENVDHVAQELKELVFGVTKEAAGRSRVGVERKLANSKHIRPAWSRDTLVDGEVGLRLPNLVDGGELAERLVVSSVPGERGASVRWRSRRQLRN